MPFITAREVAVTVAMGVGDPANVADASGWGVDDTAVTVGGSVGEAGTSGETTIISGTGKSVASTGGAAVATAVDKGVAAAA